MTDGRAPEPYEVLRVRPDASPEEIRRAFRRLALVHHPDVSKVPGATRRFQQINDAYQAMLEQAQKARKQKGTSANTGTTAEPKTGGGAGASASSGSETEANPTGASSAGSASGGTPGGARARREARQQARQHRAQETWERAARVREDAERNRQQREDHELARLRYEQQRWEKEQRLAALCTSCGRRKNPGFLTCYGCRPAEERCPRCEAYKHKDYPLCYRCSRQDPAQRRAGT